MLILSGYGNIICGHGCRECVIPTVKVIVAVLYGISRGSGDCCAVVILSAGSVIAGKSSACKVDCVVRLYTVDIDVIYAVLSGNLELGKSCGFVDLKSFADSNCCLGKELSAGKGFAVYAAALLDFGCAVDAFGIHGINIDGEGGIGIAPLSIEGLYGIVFAEVGHGCRERSGERSGLALCVLIPACECKAGILRLVNNGSGDTSTVGGCYIADGVAVNIGDEFDCVAVCVTNGDGVNICCGHCALGISSGVAFLIEFPSIGEVVTCGSSYGHVIGNCNVCAISNLLGGNNGIITVVDCEGILMLCVGRNCSNRSIGHGSGIKIRILAVEGYCVACIGIGIAELPACEIITILRGLVFACDLDFSVVGDFSKNIKRIACCVFC